MSVRRIVWWMDKLDETRENEAQAIKDGDKGDSYGYDPERDRPETD